ncbi:MAG: Fe-S cluster assembly protein SufD [Spirochaetales bacterium]|nr:Fe-S cluster assembly protein SufD [Spirochaetales bacterium]
MNDLLERAAVKGSILERSKRINEPGWLTTIREKAFDAFESMSWPQPDEEEWRRTNLDGIDLDSARILAALQKAPAVDINGAELEAARPFLERSAGEMTDRFAALNLSLWSAGRLVYVPDGTVLDEPVVIDYPGDAAAVHNSHTLVVLGREARATVVQRFSGGGADALWNTGVTVGVGDGARCSFLSIQDVNGGANFFQQSRFYLDSYGVLDSFECLIGAKLSKTRNEVYLDGPAGEARLNGIFYARDGQHMDMRTVQYHLQRAGRSRALYKGAVSGSGRSIYQGFIWVDEEAPGTDAYLTNKNLILNDGARADSIPSLEIRTDDVKCSHGSTTGKLDEEALFYMMSRGLSRGEARKELISGFFEDLIAGMPESEREPVRSRILKLIG